jgi:hypothetical protein
MIIPPLLPRGTQLQETLEVAADSFTQIASVAQLVIIAEVASRHLLSLERQEVLRVGVALFLVLTQRAHQHVAVATHGKCSPLMSNGLLLLLGQFLDHAICLLYRCL